jgi:uncharacterized protein (TIGR02266 family)
VDVAGRFREYVQLDRRRVGEGLTPAELHRFEALKRFLGRHFSPGMPPDAEDARRSVRVPTRVKVSFSSEGELARCLMTNISRHGVFVQTEHPAELKSQFDLHIQIEDPPREIAVPVEVVSVGVGPQFAANRQGMGLRFLDADPDVEKQIRVLYEQAVR